MAKLYSSKESAVVFDLITAHAHLSDAGYFLCCLYYI